MRRIFRRLAPFVFSAALAAVTAEAIVRVYFATEVGRSVLYYGTPWQRNEMALALTDHRNVIGDYRPYAPGRTGAYSKYVITTEQLKSGIVDPWRLPTLTYDEEVRLVREKMARGEIGPAKFRPLFLGPDLDLARVFLIHAQLMHDLRAWAMTADVGFVDLITVLDHDRHLLVSYVHLRPEGNRKIGAALAAEILRELLAP